jgi:MFS family permease
MSNRPLDHSSVSAGQGRRGPLADRPFILGLLLIAVSVFLIHDLTYLLTHPYWLDEAWVAVLAGFPLDEIRGKGSGAPLGWLLLMRLIPGDNEQRLRLLPLAFSAASVIVAGVMVHAFDWNKRWQARVAGIVIALGVALAPAALLRNDLKQYTADAFFALLMLHFAARLDQGWSRSRFVQMILVGLLAAFFSYVSMFVTAALILGILIVAIRDNREHVREVLVGGAATAALFIAFAALIVFPGVTPLLYDYWNAYYLSVDSGLIGVPQAVWRRFSEITSAAGVGGATLGVILGLLGVWALVKLHRHRLAVGLLLLTVLMIVLGLLRKYPFLESRTSHFLIVTFVVVALTGVMFAIFQIAGNHRSAALGAVALVVAGLVANSWPNIRSHSISNQDVRSQVRFVENAFLPGDIVLVNMTGSFGATYYWRSDAPIAVEHETLSNGWMAQLERDDFIFATDRTEAAIGAALEEALEHARRTGGRLWIIRSHVVKGEPQMWETVFAERSLEVKILPVGPEPLILIESEEATAVSGTIQFGGNTPAQTSLPPRA